MEPGLVGVERVHQGCLSFMLSDEITTGAVECSDSERRRRSSSVAWNTSQPEFNATISGLRGAAGRRIAAARAGAATPGSSRGVR